MTLLPLIYASLTMLLIIALLRIFTMLYYVNKDMKEDFQNQQDLLNEDKTTFIDKPLNKTN